MERMTASQLEQNWMYQSETVSSETSQVQAHFACSFVWMLFKNMTQHIQVINKSVEECGVVGG